MRTETYGTVFTSYDGKANKLRIEEINEETISFDDTIKKTNEVKNIVYHTTTQSDDAKSTTFIDPETQKYVIASLENAILDKLREKFGTDDVVEKEDGSIRLTDKAEAFVAGWFADIAYKREFLKADKNNDGKIGEDEYKNVKNSYNSEDSQFYYIDEHVHVTYFGEKVTEQYVKYDKDNISYRNHHDSKGLPTSLDDELNMTLNLDKDFDGNMTLKESYMETNESLEDTVINDINSGGETYGGKFLIRDASKIGSFSTFLIDILDKCVQIGSKDNIDVDSSFTELYGFILEMFSKICDKSKEGIMDKLMVKINEMDIYDDEEIKKFEKISTEDYLGQLENVKLEKEKR